MFKICAFGELEWLGTPSDIFTYSGTLGEILSIPDFSYVLQSLKNRCDSSSCDCEIPLRVVSRKFYVTLNTQQRMRIQMTQLTIIIMDFSCVTPSLVLCMFIFIRQRVIPLLPELCRAMGRKKFLSMSTSLRVENPAFTASLAQHSCIPTRVSVSFPCLHQYSSRHLSKLPPNRLP